MAHFILLMLYIPSKANKTLALSIHVYFFFLWYHIKIIDTEKSL